MREIDFEYTREVQEKVLEVFGLSVDDNVTELEMTFDRIVITQWNKEERRFVKTYHQFTGVVAGHPLGGS